MGKASARQESLVYKESVMPRGVASRNGLRGSTKRSVPIEDGEAVLPDNPVGHWPSIDAVRATRQCILKDLPRSPHPTGFA